MKFEVYVTNFLWSHSRSDIMLKLTLSSHNTDDNIAKEECDAYCVLYISSWETAKDLWLKPLTYHAIHAQQVLHHWCYMNLKTLVGYVQNTAHAAVKKTKKKSEVDLTHDGSSQFLFDLI